jgi:hypothetical protein
MSALAVIAALAVGLGLGATVGWRRGVRYGREQERFEAQCAMGVMSDLSLPARARRSGM